MNYEGDIKDFPVEVVEWMLDQQVKQGNRRNVKVFERNRWSGIDEKGFTWAGCPDGRGFCFHVIACKNFDLFFETYPRQLNTEKAEAQQTELGRLIDERGEFIKECRDGKHDPVIAAIRLKQIDDKLAEAANRK